MILLRISDLEGLYCEIVGGQAKFKYNVSKAGWLPIEDVSFGFKTVTDASTDKTSTSSGNRPGGTSSSVSTSGRGAAGSGASGGSNKESEDDFTKIQVQRFVDGATTELMGIAMDDRRQKEKGKSKRKADIHFLHSVRAKEEMKPRYIMPYLLITLDNVLIKGWSITASGDDRPTESLELWYDKAAMMYYRTIDGQTWTGGDIKGWDQYNNKPWEKHKIKSDFFIQPDYS